MPARLTYLVILAVLALFVGAAYGHQLPRLLRSRAFWLSGLVYLAACTLLELVGLSRGWWRFDWTRVCGLALLGVPLEEFALFALIFTLSIAAWEDGG